MSAIPNRWSQSAESSNYRFEQQHNSERADTVVSVLPSESIYNPIAVQSGPTAFIKPRTQERERGSSKTHSHHSIKPVNRIYLGQLHVKRLICETASCSNVSAQQLWQQSACCGDDSSAGACLGAPFMVPAHGEGAAKPGCRLVAAAQLLLLTALICSRPATKSSPCCFGIVLLDMVNA